MSNLKEYVVTKTPDDQFEVWTKEEYDSYVRHAMSVGGGSAYRIVTHFNAHDSLLNGTDESVAYKDKEIETLKAENSKMRELLTKIEGRARRFGNRGTNPEKEIEVIEKLATEALKNDGTKS